MGLVSRKITDQRWVGNVEAPQQIMQRAEDLLGERGRDSGLLQAALAKQGRQPSFPSVGKQARSIEQQLKSGKQRVAPQPSQDP